MIFKFVVALVCCLPLAQAVCYCPVVCENCWRSGDYSHEVGRAPCNDIESQKECEKANWEISDMQWGLINLVDHFLDNALETQAMTMLQIGYARALLALAMEDVKPEGDCSNGLSTDTGIQGTLTHCYSPELLRECAKVRDAVDSYQQEMSTRFANYFIDAESTYSHNPFLTFMRRSLELGLANRTSPSAPAEITHATLLELIEIVRFRTFIKTARIRCASFEATTEELSSGSRTILGNAQEWLLLLVAGGVAAASFWLS